MPSFLHRLLDNAIFAMSSITTALVSGGAAMSGRIETVLGIIALVCSIFSTIAVGVYHAYKIQAVRRRALYPELPIARGEDLSGGTGEEARREAE